MSRVLGVVIGILVLAMLLAPIAAANHAGGHTLGPTCDAVVITPSGGVLGWIWIRPECLDGDPCNDPPGSPSRNECGG